MSCQGTGACRFNQAQDNTVRRYVEWILIDLEDEAAEQGLPAPDKKTVQDQYLRPGVVQPDLATLKDFMRFFAATSIGRLDEREHRVQIHEGRLIYRTEPGPSRVDLSPQGENRPVLQEEEQVQESGEGAEAEKNKRPTVDSVLIAAEWFFAGFCRITGTEVETDDRSEVYNFIRTRLVEEGYAVNLHKPKHNFTE